MLLEEESDAERDKEEVVAVVDELQSGVCTDTSTYGSMCLSIISCPVASLGRGNCCAEITWRVVKRKPHIYTIR